MTDALKKMREPFPQNQISYLPKGGVKLAYVGHAALTDRLLDVDPSWTWEPLALDDRGLPALDEVGGLWIKLTVCGVTRLGYGDAGQKKGGDAMKERIGDALRNAAMRFGAALDLWHKGDLHGDDDGAPTGVDSNTGEVTYQSVRKPRVKDRGTDFEPNPAHTREPEPIIGMAPSVLQDWLQAIEQCADDRLEVMVRDGLAAATEVKDREAFVAIRQAGKKREGATA